MTSPTTHRRPDVLAYVAAVRAHLDDLGADEVEELAGGLEADLADLAAESNDPLVDRLGPPQAYADELRSAAGLPARDPRRRRPSVLDQLRQHPRWPALAGFATALRPAWWVARAWVAYSLVVLVTGYTGGFFALALLAVMAVVSVELGRGRWRRHTWLAPLVLVGNVVAGVVLPFAVSAVPMGGLGSGPGQPDTLTEPVQPGLTRNGEPVRNVFAYDRDGRPLTDVQLFDERGRPLALDPSGATVFDEACCGSTQPAPHVDAYGRQVWNVFPLRQQRVTTGDDELGTAPTTAAPTPAPLPVPSVPPLATTASSTSTTTNSPTSTATNSPTSTATPAPPSTATATRSR